MTVTYQSNVLDISYNGWENYETWNVALWINNDQGLYDIASECGSYQDFVAYISEFMTQTPDGVKFNDPAVNVIQLNSDLFDFWFTLKTHTVTNSMATQTEFQKIINDLTPEERQALKNATAPEWIKAIRDLINDPQFWQEIRIAFVEGVAEGISNALADDNYQRRHK